MIEIYVNEILQHLSLSFAVSSFKVKKLRIVEDEGFMRVRCNLNNGDILEFAEYVKILQGEPKIQTYRYHGQKSDGTLVKRWDNVPHHPEIASFPNHLHQSDGKVEPSPSVNFSQVLSEMEKSIKASEQG